MLRGVDEVLLKRMAAPLAEHEARTCSTAQAHGPGHLRLNLKLRTAALRKRMAEHKAEYEAQAARLRKRMAGPQAEYEVQAARLRKRMAQAWIRAVNETVHLNAVKPKVKKKNAHQISNVDIEHAVAALPSGFVECVDELHECRAATCSEVKEVFKLAKDVYWKRVGRRSNGGRIRGKGGKFRREGDAYIIACLLLMKGVRNQLGTLPDKSLFSAMAAAFNESENVIKKAWYKALRSKRPYKRRVS